ncbi:MAG: hypothetical protein LBI86_06020 [Treponema sp.]|jgi:hypothetical protein|nr:hypothetical protein [Treponema sp.]
MTHSVSSTTTNGVSAFCSRAFRIAGALMAAVFVAACGSPAGSAMVNGFGSGGGGGGETVTLVLRINGEDISGSGTGTGESPVSLSYNFTLADRDKTPTVVIVSTSGSLVGKTVRLTLTGSDASAEISDADYAALVAAINAAIGSGVSVNVGSGLTQRASYTAAATSAGISDIGGTNTGVIINVGSATEITFSAFSVENSSPVTFSGVDPATYITDKNVTVNVSSGVTLEELSFGWAARVKRALAGAASVTFNIPSSITPVFKGEDMIKDVEKSLNHADNANKVFAEFSVGSTVFSGFKVASDGGKLYLDNEGNSPVKVDSLKFFAPYPSDPIKLLGFGLQSLNTPTFTSDIRVGAGQSSFQMMTPDDLDKGFMMLGINWKEGSGYPVIDMQNIKLVAGYQAPISNPFNLFGGEANLRVIAYIEENIINSSHADTLALNHSLSTFRYAASTVPYDDTQPDGIATNPATLSGDLALWMLSKGISITNAKISNPSITEPKTLGATLTNIVLEGDKWKQQNFSTVGLNGVVTFNGDLPTGNINVGSNLWLVVNGNVGTKSLSGSIIKILEFDQFASNMSGFNPVISTHFDNNNSEVRLKNKSHKDNIHNILKNNDRKFWLYSSTGKYKFINSTSGNPLGYGGSPSKTDGYDFTKGTWATNVYSNTSFSPSPTTIAPQNVWGGAIVTLPPSRPRRRKRNGAWHRLG